MVGAARAQPARTEVAGVLPGGHRDLVSPTLECSVLAGHHPESDRYRDRFIRTARGCHSCSDLMSREAVHSFSVDWRSRRRRPGIQGGILMARTPLLGKFQRLFEDYNEAE